MSNFGFTNSTNNEVQSLAATNSTLYAGGRFSRVNGVLRTALAAVNAASGVVDESFDNQLSGGIGVNGQLGVPQLKLTHDSSKLLVVHTGRKIDGQDRYGMGIIDTATKELLPWRSTLWDDNLARVGGVTRIVAADIAPDDSYFVVTSGSGGGAPPISDTAIAYPLNPTSVQDSDVCSRYGSHATSTASTRSPSPRSRSTSAATSASWSPRRPTIHGPAWTTSATEPARGWRATAWATRWSGATTLRL